MSWPTQSLGAICEIVSGITKDSKKQGDDYREVPYLRVANVQRLQLDHAEVKTIPAKESSIASYRLEPGDILLNEGGDRDKLGRGWIWQGQISECIHQNHVFRARIRDGKAVPKWIAYYANTNEARAYFLESGKQTTNLASISKKNLSAFPVPLPPVHVQETLVAEIDTQLSRLDEVVTTLQGIQAKLKQARASILKAAVEGRLVETEAEWARSDGREYEDATSFLARITSGKQGKSSKMRKLPDRLEETEAGMAHLTALPEGWSLVTISDVGETITGSTPPTSEPDFYEDKGIPFLKPTDLNDGINTGSARQYLSAKGSSRARLVPPLTVLVTCIGATIGKTGLATSLCATNQQINCLIPSPEIAKTKYLFWYLRSPFAQYDITANASATTLPILNKSKFSRLPIFLPPPAEQYRIAAEVERRFSVLDQVEATVQASIARCTKLRQAILKSLLKNPATSARMHQLPIR